MYVLKDKGIITEVESGNNFGYVLSEDKYFVGTDYKVLQSQSNGIFIQCMKMLYNGKIEIYYITDEYRPISSMFGSISQDTLIHVIVNMFGCISEVRENGFLQIQNTDLSWDKIFVDSNTLKVKLVYLPVNVRTFDSYAEYESELRASLIKLINKILPNASGRIEKFLEDLANGSMTIEDIHNKYKGAGMPILSQHVQNHSAALQQNGNKLKLVAMNAPQYFEVVLDRPQMLLGKKKELVDVAITFNNMISRKHCKVTIKDGLYYIEDEGSVNGTFVNGLKLIPHQKQEVKKGDVIRMADSNFQLV